MLNMGSTEKATLDDINNLVGRRVLIRADYNVPLSGRGGIADDNRIRESLETVKYCLKRGAKVILCSHFGRPEGIDKKYSLEIVAEHLRKLLPKTTIYFANDCIGDIVVNQSKILKNGEILLLENTRFHKEEEQNDAHFAEKLSQLGDIFVNDAFGTAHRAHASTAGVANYLPAVAGFLIQKEIKYLSAIVKSPKRPLTVICGGKKVADKLPIIEHLIDKADNILIGGAISAQWKLTQKSAANIVVSKDTGFDIGEQTIRDFTDVIGRSSTIFWNGPMGVYEDPEYANGTKQIALAVISATKNGSISIVGGGDTAAAVTELVGTDGFTHISTGGGASLEFIEGKTLPGIKCLLTVREFNKIKQIRGI
jgi:triosephosphate isomerase